MITDKVLSLRALLVAGGLPGCTEMLAGQDWAGVGTEPCWGGEKTLAAGQMRSLSEKLGPQPAAPPPSPLSPHCEHSNSQHSPGPLTSLKLTSR